MGGGRWEVAGGKYNEPRELVCFARLDRRPASMLVFVVGYLVGLAKGPLISRDGFTIADSILGMSRSGENPATSFKEVSPTVNGHVAGSLNPEPL